MPKIARTFIKTGLIYFLGSLLLGIVMEIPALNLPALTPLFWHMLMVGWITQIIFGVSLWMFPGRNREEGFRAQMWGWLTYLFLNTGLIMRIVAEPALAYTQSSFLTVLITASAVLQVFAAAAYVREMWPRVQPKKKRLKRRKKMKEGS